ncbi:hypothetical protein HETIRDRAFT_428025 [Heterobasidion irregulare TC 32-1]|uniref:RNase H type-1 domain-containing protein n=1 Tax=Heterobasidion irregulare (strain TC 32-1) TaxID=747525 RepID=W4K349_HETIT|nr:uncharacterized protein HETIRDRAFT_428025 [Heterobasidion irregulare TC 32-1]ETW79491.1 hypothetical protein HETIRDRAFT_428025 [Heterobasidion irregulare TC 32-1]
MLYGVDIFLSPPSREGKGSKGMIEKLARVQRQAAIHITGAMRTTATDILDAHADLLPFSLLVDKKCHDEATRLATLADEHPLYRHTIAAADATTHTPDRSPLHRLLNEAYAIFPSQFEDIKAVRLDPKWQSAIQTSIAPNKDGAIEAEKQNRDEIQVYSDGSLIEGGVGAAAVLFRHGNEKARLHKHLGRAEHHTVYEAELTGILLALQLIQNEPPHRSASIALDNVAAIQATKIARSTPGSYLVDAIHDKVEKEFGGRGRGRPTLRWVPGHVDIVGNERSDEEAKAAARGLTSMDTRFKKTFGDLNLPKTMETELDGPRSRNERRTQPTTPRARGGGGHRGATRLVQIRTAEQRQMAATLRSWLNTAPATGPNNS